MSLKNLFLNEGKAYAKGPTQKKPVVGGDNGEQLEVPDILVKQTKTELDLGKRRSGTSMLSKLSWLVNKVQPILNGDHTSKSSFSLSSTLLWSGLVMSYQNWGCDIVRLLEA